MEFLKFICAIRTADGFSFNLHLSLVFLTLILACSFLCVFASINRKTQTIYSRKLYNSKVVSASDTTCGLIELWNKHLSLRNSPALFHREISYSSRNIASQKFIVNHLKIPCDLFKLKCTYVAVRWIRAARCVWARTPPGAARHTWPFLYHKIVPLVSRTDFSVQIPSLMWEKYDVLRRPAWGINLVYAFSK